LPRVVVPLADGLVVVPGILDEKLLRLGTGEVPSLKRLRSRLGHQRHRLFLRRDLPLPEPGNLPVRERKPLVYHPETPVAHLVLCDAHFTSPLWQTGVSKSVAPVTDSRVRGVRPIRRGGSASA